MRVGARTGHAAVRAGRRSNVLVADTGFDGLALHIALAGMEQEGELLCAAAGTPWGRLRQGRLLERIVPASSARRNSRHRGWHARAECRRVRAGSCFGNRARAGVRSCSAEVREFANADCGFAYRKSRFNTMTEEGMSSRA